MKFEINNVSVIYPNEDSAEERMLTIENDAELLQFNFIDKKINTGSMVLDLAQVKILKDYLDLILKNKVLTK